MRQGIIVVAFILGGLVPIQAQQGCRVQHLYPRKEQKIEKTDSNQQTDSRKKSETLKENSKQNRFEKKEDN